MPTWPARHTTRFHRDFHRAAFTRSEFSIAQICIEWRTYNKDAKDVNHECRSNMPRWCFKRPFLCFSELEFFGGRGGEQTNKELSDNEKRRAWQQVTREQLRHGGTPVPRCTCRKWVLPALQLHHAYKLLFGNKGIFCRWPESAKLTGTWGAHRQLMFCSTGQRPRRSFVTWVFLYLLSPFAQEEKG